MSVKKDGQKDGKPTLGKAVSQFIEVLATTKTEITKYDPAKPRSVFGNAGPMNVEKFCDLLKGKLGSNALNFPEVFQAIHDSHLAKEVIEAYAAQKGLLVDGSKTIPIPPDLQNLTLNMNMSAKGREDRFFLTNPDETVSPVSGEMYLLVAQMSPPEAAAVARKVIPDYLPRGPVGISEIKIDGKKRTIFNMYAPPAWTRYRGWDKLPDKLPTEFNKLIRHQLPIPEEREFFFAWLHDSLFKRSYTFLILCSSPGTGKNRLKLVLRALHGHLNTCDGKKSTLVERFNSQLSESTLAWFDELRYDADMENTMKEIQNDSISIERKGVDATRATKLHASLVISNNIPRDNHIAFDARKFVPLMVTNQRLEKSMTPEEIDALTNKVEDPASDTFDLKFIAQIAKWVKKHGRSKKWPNLEYKGPMFWTLAHTSMTQWQKKAVMFLLESETRTERAGWDSQKNAFLWSAIQAKLPRRNNDRYLNFPDPTTVRAFFDCFRDGKGRKTFVTEAVPGLNILGDFWVRPIIKNTKVITEASILKKMEGRNEKSKKEFHDL